jgi:Chaperone of endosialidase
MKTRTTSSLLITLLLVCFALLPRAQALLPPPPPDGGYPGFNTAEGDGALFNLTTGIRNTAIGFDALFSNTNGEQNTATGVQALFHNTIGSENTATGAFALDRNTTGDNNTASGSFALFSNTTGHFNTAVGSNALELNTTGGFNTATGISALNGNTTGRFNTASGGIALASNTIGSNNTASGYSALAVNSIGLNNTAVGYGALLRNTRGSSNIGLGVNAGSNLNTGSNNIDIGNAGVAAEANTIRIGVQGSHTRTFVAGISGSPITGTSVVVNTFGRLGTAASSQRFKDDIKPMDKASEAILALKPVTFRYKEEIDPDRIPQFGLIAEEVEKVNPDLVVRDDQGKIYSVRYDQVNAMLLNEFIKQHRKVEEQQATIAELKKAIAHLAARDKEQDAKIQKVSAQIEMSRPARQLASNDD